MTTTGDFDVIYELIDNRMQQELNLNELEHFIDTDLRSGDFIYRYDERSKRHYLSLKGLWRYIPLTNLDRQRDLFKLPSLYPHEKIPAKELLREVNELLRTINIIIPYGDGDCKYNWMLSTMARNVDYGTNWADRIAKNPQLLLYDERMDSSFDELFASIPDKYIIFKMPQENIFAPILSSIQILIFRSDVTLTEMKRIAEGFGLACMHVSFHMKIPHMFVYTNEETQNQHIARNIIADWIQDHRLRSGEGLRITRVTERLVVLAGSERAYKLQTLGNLYPVTSGEVNFSFPNQVSALLELYEEYINNPEPRYRDVFKLVTENRKYVFLTRETYEAYILKGVPCFYIWIKSLPAFVTSDYRSTIVKSEDARYIRWDLSPVGNYVLEKGDAVYGSSISDAAVKVMDVALTNKRLTNGIIVLVENPVYSNEITSFEEDALKRSAEERFIHDTSRILIHLNNKLRIISDVRSTVINTLNYYNTNTDVKFSISVVEQLLLFATTNREFIVNEGYLLPGKEDFNMVERFNNSTLKLIMIYITLLNKFVAYGVSFDEETKAVLPRGTTLAILGAIKEPAVEILNDWHYKYQGRRPVFGYGDEAQNDMHRTRLPLDATQSIHATFVISDIDQERSRFESFNAYVEFVDALVAECTRISGVGAIKINYPSEFILLRMVRAIRKTYNNAVRTALVRNGFQNGFTLECFLIYDSNSPIRNVQAGVYHTSSFSSIISDYMRSDVEDLSPQLPVISRNIDLDNLDLDTCTLFKMRIPIHELYDAMTLLAQCCREIRTMRDAMSDTVYVFGKSSSNRLQLTERGIDCRFDLSLLKDSIPHGLGKFSGNPTIIHEHNRAKWTLLHKFATYLAIYDYILENDISVGIRKMVSIGGRDLADIACCPNDLEYIVQDPQARMSDLSSKRITIILDPLDFANIVLDDDTIYIAIFVIMNAVNGTAVSSAYQLDILRRIANAVALKRNSHFIVNVYTQELVHLLSWMNSGDLINVNEDGNISFGVDWLPTETVRKTTINDTLSVIGGINHKWIDLHMHHVARCCMREGLLLDAYEREVLSCALLHMNPIIISKS